MNGQDGVAVVDEPVVRVGGRSPSTLSTGCASTAPRGFLGIGAKPVALPVNQLNFMRGIGGDVHATTSLTKDEVQALPEHHH